MDASFVRDVFKLIPTAKRGHGIGVVILLVASSLLDFFSLALFLPLIFILIDPRKIQDNPLFQVSYDLFNFTSLNAFVLALTVFTFLFIVIKTLINLWITKKKAEYAYGIGDGLASRVVNRYLNLSHQQFTHTDLSNEVNLISNMPLVFSNNIIIPIGTLLSEVGVFLLLLVSVALFDIRAFGTVLIILVPAYLLYHLRKRKIKRIGEDIRSTYPLLLKYALLITEGLQDIKAFGKEAFFKNKFERVSQKLSKILSRDHATHTGTPRLTEIIAAGCICGMIAYTVLFYNRQQETLILLTVYVGASFRIIPSINRILGCIQQMKVHEYSVKSFIKILNEHVDPFRATQDKLPFEKEIDLKNISFGYSENETILRVNITIRKGQRVALVGKSGTGKTTLLLIMLRFLKEQAGHVMVDGQIINEANESAWKKLIGFVPQNPYIMDGTVSENIAFGVPQDQIDYEKVNQLIMKMDLSEWASSLGHGIQTRIGEKGAKISGGQRQRLAIARALYHDAELLLLDEVTNQLDPETEKEIIGHLLMESDKNKTIVMITHHPDLLGKFDIVYQLSNESIRKLDVLQPITVNDK
jgi:ABC-type multidrug transport system fused ATPase/permease subunit